ncbi:MAG: transglutaminase family protein [Pseudomonadota bacterium]
MGGEPTFVSTENLESPEWNEAALGEHKLERSGALMSRLRDAFAPQGLTTFAQGKWYPGEPTPRWALICHWRTDGEPIWRNPERLINPGNGKSTAQDAERLVSELTALLALEPSCARAVYEDPLHHIHLEAMLPVDTPLSSLKLGDKAARAETVRQIDQGLDKPVGWILPLEHTGSRWISCRWPLRREEVFLMPGDSPAGMRLPLDTLPPDHSIDREARQAQQDHFYVSESLPTHDDLSRRVSADAARARTVDDAVIRTTLVTEVRDGTLYVFLPPVRSAAHWVHLMCALEQAAERADVRCVIEGYEPPHDARLQAFRITPDPGVIEVNIHPSSSFDELVERTESLYDAAAHCKLAAEKFMVDGRHTGTGGGNHVTLGGMTPQDSPFLRRPELLASLIRYWQHHPSLSYLFSGLFVGPTSQAPRADEARSETLYELEMAVARMPRGDAEQPWLVDRLLRNILVDLTGNTHRAEICIDKLYSPSGPAGRLGIVELRAFEMPPHARMSVVQTLLIRCLISRFWNAPYTGKLVRWGTELHDKYMLPHYLWRDLEDVVADLHAHGYDFDASWLDAFFEFRFPVYGEREIGDVTLQLRAAIEPWHVLGEEATASGMSRYVDSSVERLQLRVSGMTESRHIVTCNGYELPLISTGTPGEFVVGVRYRAWQPPFSLHPDLPVDVPLVFDLIDTWNNRSIGGCAYHVSDPGGRAFDDKPVNANVAETRRLTRFDVDQHTPAPAFQHAPAEQTSRFRATEPTAGEGPRVIQRNADYPCTADLRRVRSF